jgi:hypothetical protein
MIALLILGMIVGCGDEAQSPAAEAAAPAPSASPADEAAAPAAEEASEEAVADLSGDWTHYGEAFTVEKADVATALLADPSQYLDQTVRVTGRVADVCQKAACWLVLAEDEKLLRVTMKDHAFAVHKRGAGGEADIEGLVVAKAIDPKEVAHFKGESEHPDKIPEAKATGTTTYELVASSVSMRKVAADL